MKRLIVGLFVVAAAAGSVAIAPTAGADDLGPVCVEETAEPGQTVQIDRQQPLQVGEGACEPIIP